MGRIITEIGLYGYIVILLYYCIVILSAQGGFGLGGLYIALPLNFVLYLGKFVPPLDRTSKICYNIAIKFSIVKQT